MAGPTLLLLLSVIAAESTPAWVNRGAHPKYPAEKFLLGVGSASVTGDEKRDAEAAEASARKDLVSQIQVSVKGVSEAYEEEIRRGGQVIDRARFSDRTEQSVSGTLEGARIVEVHSDGGKKTRWALAVLDKGAAAAGLKSAMAAADKNIRAAFDKAGVAASGDLALRALLEAYQEAEKNEATQVLYRALTRTTADAIRPADVREKVLALGSLELKVKSGDGQPATGGQPLAEPVVFALSIGGRALGDAPLSVRLDGPGKVDARVKTGSDGSAPVRVSEAGSTGSPEQHVLAAADWGAWLGERGAKVSAAAFGLVPIEARAAYRFKTVATTRIAILIDEKIVWKDAAKTEPPKDAIFAPRISALLSSRGFDVRPATSLGKLSASEVASAAPGDLKVKLEGQAEVVITGVITSEFANRMCDKCPTFHKAGGSLRAIDTRTGQLVAEVHEPGKRAVGTSETSAGTKAIEEAAKEKSAELVEALIKALNR